MRLLVAIFFFFQAEDGIRDYKVTGVQTCALPISVQHDPDRREQPRNARKLAAGGARDVLGRGRNSHLCSAECANGGVYLQLCGVLLTHAALGDEEEAELGRLHLTTSSYHF